METLVNTNHPEPKRSKYDSYKNYRKVFWPLDSDTSWVHKDDVTEAKRYGAKVVTRKRKK